MNKTKIRILNPIEFDNFITSIVIPIINNMNDTIKKCTIDELDNSPEIIAYRRIRDIANAKISNVDFAIAIHCLTDDVKLISKLIRDDNLKHPEEIKEFIENTIAIMDVWDNQYRETFDIIKEFKDSCKTPKSIDEMDADELRKYIKTHNIK